MSLELECSGRTTASDAGRIKIDRQEICLRLGRVLARDGGDMPMAIAYFQKALDGDEAFAGEALTLSRKSTPRQSVGVMSPAF